MLMHLFLPAGEVGAAFANFTVNPVWHRADVLSEAACCDNAVESFCVELFPKTDVFPEAAVHDVCLLRYKHCTFQVKLYGLITSCFTQQAGQQSAFATPCGTDAKILIF